MLQVQDLYVTIEDNTILADVDLGVSDGEIVGILGPSGSGKSTLLRAIAGIIEPASGAIYWDGENITTVPTHKRRFGLMFQGYALFPHLTVGENVAFGLVKGADRQVEEALAWVGMNGFSDRTVDDLSGGEKQRVALARTLAPRPRLVMLDEPLGALDRSLRSRLVTETRALLKDREATAIVVTHDAEEADAICDRLALLREGRIVQTGTLSELVADPADQWVADFLG
ncbi:MAG: ABC transporter ATP-binding protein [Acidimicrobiia bacterium]